MYLLRTTKKFEKSIKKIKRSGLKLKTHNEIEVVIDLLQSGKKLNQKYRDHQLTGDLKEYRECHIQSDLLLVYKIYNNELILVLVDIGSHSELFR
jgi:mRNA interferase YafQ